MTELTSMVISELGMNAKPQSVFDKACQIARDALRGGESIDMLGVVRVRLTADALAGKCQGRDALYAEPLPGLVPGTVNAGKKETVVVIAVEKSDRFSQMLAKRLCKPGRNAMVAEGLTGVMDVVKRYGADVVIMDSNLEMGDEIRIWLKTAPERSLISLIVVYGGGEDADVIEQFRICEDEFLFEPYEMQVLESMIVNEIIRIELERKYFNHEVSFQFPTRQAYQQEAGDFLERLVAHSGLNDEEQMGLIVAFREAVDNASRHGNRSDGQALVSVAYVVDKEKVTVTVEDEGPGFDAMIYLEKKVSGDAIASARARHKEGREGGLGIMLMLRSVDKLEYNREGNMVKLTRFLPKKK